MDPFSCQGHHWRAEACLTGVGHTDARPKATMRQACAVCSPPSPVVVMDPRWRSRQGEEPPAMDGAARAGMIHGMVGSSGAAMMHGMVGSITTVVVMDPRWRTRNGGQPPAMHGAARPAMIHGMVGSNDELFRQALAVRLAIIHGGGAGRAPW